MILYKYFPNTVNSFKSISLGSVWCDRSINMNDPFECLAVAQRKLSDEQITEIRKYCEKSNSGVVKRIADLNDTNISIWANEVRRKLIKDHYAFCSLSKTPDNILLWSHYATAHTGFVVGIDFDENDYSLQPVRYLTALPEFDVMGILKIVEIQSENEELLKLSLRDLSVKSIDWEYENEVRLCLKRPGYYRFGPERVKEIYFGLNCSTEVIAIVTGIMSYVDSNVPLKKMTFGEDPVRLVALEDWKLPEVDFLK